MDPDRSDLLARLDTFLDDVPRASSDPIDVGRFRAFVSRVSWPYYSRPRPDVDLTAVDVEGVELEAAAAALRDAGQPVSFEWVHERVPSMHDVAVEQGYDVTLYPMLVLDTLRPIDPPEGVEIIGLTAHDARIADAGVVAQLAFGAAGTDPGPTGPAVRDAELAARDPEADSHARSQLAADNWITVVAIQDGGVVGTGTCQHVHGVGEIVGVGVLPSHRRRGIAAALTTTLVHHAHRSGIDVVMLSAGSPDIARVYERVGFTRIGHAGSAELRAEWTS